MFIFSVVQPSVWVSEFGWAFCGSISTSVLEPVALKMQFLIFLGGGHAVGRDFTTAEKRVLGFEKYVIPAKSTVSGGVEGGSFGKYVHFGEFWPGVDSTSEITPSF